jgi:hypothetical protein
LQFAKIHKEPRMRRHANQEIGVPRALEV